MRRVDYAANKDSISAQKRAAYAARKVREIVAIDVEESIIESGKFKQFVGQEIVKHDNLSIRMWYVANVSNIPNLIDGSAPIETQARQAFDLRNKYKHKAIYYWIKSSEPPGSFFVGETMRYIIMCGGTYEYWPQPKLLKNC